MDHETASGLLGDHARGRLDPGQRRQVEAHLATCSECRDVAALLPAVQQALQEHGPALFDAHPSPEQLGQFALASDELDAPEQSRVAAHARACPTCANEVDLTRRAQRTAWARSPQAWAHAAGRKPAAAWLRPALAVSAIAAVALIYPAYLGLVRYPEVRRVAARATTGGGPGDQQPRASEAPTPWSGAVGMLTLAGATRESAAGAADATVPEVALRPGQPYLPLLIAYEPPVPAQQSIEVRVVRDGQVVWSMPGTLAALWDRGAEAMVLLAPASPLAPGDYALELRWTDAASPDWRSDFRVILAPQP